MSVIKKPITINERITYLVEDIVHDLYVTEDMTDDEHDAAMEDWDNQVEAIDLIIEKLLKMKEEV